MREPTAVAAILCQSLFIDLPAIETWVESHHINPSDCIKTGLGIENGVWFRTYENLEICQETIQLSFFIFKSTQGPPVLLSTSLVMLAPTRVCSVDSIAGCTVARTFNTLLTLCNVKWMRDFEFMTNVPVVFKCTKSWDLTKTGSDRQSPYQNPQNLNNTQL